jgi:hypothetical protein
MASATHISATSSDTPLARTTLCPFCAEVSEGVTCLLALAHSITADLLEEPVYLVGTIRVLAIDHGERIEFYAMLLQELEAAHHAREGGLSALVDAVDSKCNPGCRLARAAWP